MSVLEEPKEYMKDPVLIKREFGDYTAFYIAIGICTAFGGFLFLLNIVFCCCSKYKNYWKDSNTGNRWLVSIWTKTPHHQPPLDLTELEECYIPSKPITTAEHPEEYLELQKRESDL